MVNLRFDGAGTLTSASRDGTARFWDVEDRELRLVLRGHTGPVQDAVHDAGTVWTASRDGTVRSWTLDTTAVAGKACEALRPIDPTRWQQLALDSAHTDVCAS